MSQNTAFPSSQMPSSTKAPAVRFRQSLLTLSLGVFMLTGHIAQALEQCKAGRHDGVMGWTTRTFQRSCRAWKQGQSGGATRTNCDGCSALHACMPTSHLCSLSSVCTLHWSISVLFASHCLVYEMGSSSEIEATLWIGGNVSILQVPPDAGRIMSGEWREDATVATQHRIRITALAETAKIYIESRETCVPFSRAMWPQGSTIYSCGQLLVGCG